MPKSQPAVRASSLPLAVICPNAVLNPDNLIRAEEHVPAAYLGTLIHRQLELLVDTGEYDSDGLKQRLDEADFDRAEALIHNFSVVWREAKKHMPEPQSERYLTADFDGFSLSGHIDLSYVDTDNLTAYIIDYKTGRVHDDHYHQMAAYAALLWAEEGKFLPGFEVHVSAIYLEDNSVTPYTFTGAQLQEWSNEVRDLLSQNRYSVSRKCGTCSLAESCPAWNQYARNSIAAFLGEDGPAPKWVDLPAEKRGDVMDRVYVVEKAISRIKASLKSAVEKHGSLATGDGKEYTLLPHVYRSLNTQRALPILRKRLGDETVSELAEINLTQAVTRFVNKTKKGGRAKARRDLLEELEQAGAIVMDEQVRMYRRPVDEYELESTDEQ